MQTNFHNALTRFIHFVCPHRRSYKTTSIHCLNKIKYKDVKCNFVRQIKKNYFRIHVLGKHKWMMIQTRQTFRFRHIGGCRCVYL